MSLKIVQAVADNSLSKATPQQKRVDQSNSASNAGTSANQQSLADQIRGAATLNVLRANSTVATDATITNIRSSNRSASSESSKLRDPDKATELAEDLAARIRDGDGEEAHDIVEGLSRDLT